MPRHLALLLLAFCLASATIHAESRAPSRSSAQNIKRWSLDEWLEQRDRMRMMDLWLALHTPSPFEFYLGASYAWGQASDSGYYGSFNGTFAAYATIFGLEVQREFSNRDPRMLGLFHFRIFGPRAQGMNLTLQGGVRYDERSGAQLWMPTFGVSFAVYITRHFGFEGLWRKYFETDFPAEGRAISGNRYEMNVFVEFQFLRVYGGYFYDVETTASIPTLILRGGVGGIKMFF